MISEQALSNINEGGWVVRGGRLAKAQGISPGTPIVHAFVPGRPIKNIVDNHGPLEIHTDDGSILRIPPVSREISKEGGVYVITEWPGREASHEESTDAYLFSMRHTPLCRVVFRGAYLDRQQTRKGSVEPYWNVLRQGVQVILENPAAFAQFQAQKAEERKRLKAVIRREKHRRQQERRRIDRLFQQQVKLTDGMPVETIKRNGTGVVIRFSNGHELAFCLLHSDKRTHFGRLTTGRMAAILGGETIPL